MSAALGKYLRVAWQSAIAAAFGLGLPAGLLFWLILIQQLSPFVFVDGIVALLQTNGLNQIYLLTFASLIWSYLLGRISGYRPWWKIGMATSLGILVGWFSPLSNMDAWFDEKTPTHVIYAVAMCGIIFSSTSSVGLVYGLILRSWKAALTFALTTSTASILAVLITIFIFDQFGIRVGGDVPFAMSKVTITVLMTSAIAGGSVLGVAFSWFFENKNSRLTQNVSGSVSL